MPVVSLNLTEQAYRAYKQVPKGRRSQVLSAMIEKRDLDVKGRGKGVLADMGFITTEEAITTLIARLERSAKTIKQFQDADEARSMEEVEIE